MNYNANTGGRPSFGRKIKRVSDVNAMGYNPHDPSSPQQPNMYPNLDSEMPNNPYQQDYINQQQPHQQTFNNSGFQSPKPQNTSYYNGQQAQVPFNNSAMSQPQMGVPQMGVPQMGVFGQPMVQDMAMQYGQQLAGAGTTMIKQEVEKYVPVSKLKYYFAVDTKYVISKLILIFFPFTHKDWSVKYEQDGPVPPRYEINAPDLYIPTMAYITYVLVAGLVLGMQQRFSPEQIGILASSALAWCIVELAIYSCTLYVIHVETSLRTLDLLAYSGYKFVGTIFSILVYLVAGKMGYYICLIYFNLALAFFLVRSLKAQVLTETNSQQTQSYYGQQTSSGNKRRLYFLLFIAVAQPVLCWWLSFHLLQSSKTSAPTADL